ncbi:hypothetical protein O9992_27355 [Vibrio lentus]|nr:hypothetical protein [Vibrio lentus]
MVCQAQAQPNRYKDRIVTHSQRCSAKHFTLAANGKQVRKHCIANIIASDISENISNFCTSSADQVQQAISAASMLNQSGKKLRLNASSTSFFKRLVMS